jgi:hypothetical protein
MSGAVIRADGGSCASTGSCRDISRVHHVSERSRESTWHRLALELKSTARRVMAFSDNLPDLESKDASEYLRDENG